MKTLDNHELKVLYNYIYSVYMNEYAELYRIFKLPADDTLWDRYEQLGTKGMPEQKLFKKAAVALRKAWQSKYKLAALDNIHQVNNVQTNGNGNTIEENSESISNQSKEARST